MLKRIVIIGFMLSVRMFAQTTISNVYVQSSTATTATIVWTTSTPATSQIRYGLNSTIPYSNNTNYTLVTSHSMVLTFLNASQLYYFAVVSVDGSGHSAQSSTVEFALCGQPQVPVSGTINQFYYSGTYSITWNPPSGSSGNPTACGVPITTPVTGNLNLSGSFSAQIADSLKVTPGPGTWTVAVADIGDISPVSVTLPLSATTQDISAQLQAAAAATSLVGVIANNNAHTVYPPWLNAIAQGAVVLNPTGSQTITQSSGTNFNVATSAGGKDEYNGSEICTVGNGLCPNPSGVYLLLSGGALTGALNGTSASFTGTVAAGASTVGKVIQLPGGVQTAGTFASYLALYGGNTTYVLPPSYSETVTSTISLSQNNVNIQCGAGATLLNGTSGPTSPIVIITGTNDTIGVGCTVDNQFVQITSSYGYGAITLISSTNTVLNGVIGKNCGTAYESSPCITAENINGAQFDQLNLAGNLAIWAWNSQGSINWEVIGGTMNSLVAAVNGAGSTIKNYRISGTNLNAIGGDSVCGGIGVYSGAGEIGYIQNGTVTGTTCTISGTAQVTVNNVAIAGSGSTGTITLTLGAATPFWLNENITLSGFVTNTCLNAKDLQVTSTSGTSVSFSTNGTTCTTASGADSGIAKAAAFAGWSNPSYGQRGFTFEGNVVQFAQGTNQYVNYSGYEMGCTECLIKDNVFIMPDAYAQTYGCIISYSDDAIIEGNLCNGFGALGTALGVAGGVSYPSLPNNDNMQILNNTIINTAATSGDVRSKGIVYGCNYPGGHVKSGQVSGNVIIGPFSRGMDIQDSSSGYTCPVEGVFHGNQIYGATTGINVNMATVSITDTVYSGVTTQSVLANTTPEISISDTPKAFPSGSTAVTQAASDTSKNLATDAFVANWIAGQTNVLPFPYGIANGPQTAPPYTPVAWYPASSTCSTSGTTPTTLTDASGNGYTLTGTGATCQTNIVNGNPVLRFAGTGTGYKGPFGTTYTTGTTLVSIYRKTVGVSYAFLVDGYSCGPCNSIFYNPTATTLKAEANSTAITATVADDNNVHVAIYTLTSTGTGTLYLDGVQVATGTQGSSEFLNGLTVGARGGDGLVPWNGDIAETVLYGSALTSAQVQSFGQYAATKYGLVQAGTWSIVSGVARFASEYLGGNPIIACPAGGTTTQYCSAAGAWITPTAGIPVRAGTWSISSATSVAVTFAPAMSAAPTTCNVPTSASSATTGTPFVTNLATTGFTVNVPISGTIAGTYSCFNNNGN